MKYFSSTYKFYNVDLHVYGNKILKRSKNSNIFYLFESTYTKANSKVHVRLHHSRTDIALSPALSPSTVTSKPSHQHFLCVKIKSEH